MALASLFQGPEVAQVISAGLEVADTKTLQKVQRELRERRSELSLLGDKDWARRGKLAEEIERLEKYLKGAQGRAGHARKAGGTGERARVSVTLAIQRAIQRIREAHPEMAAHLETSIRTGSTMAYLPQELPDWKF